MVAIPSEQADREREHLIQKQTGETTKARCERMAFEEEYLRQRPLNAEQYLLKLQKDKEGDPELMWPLAQFYLRQGNLEKAEQYMRDCLSFDVKKDKVMLAYACLLCQCNRTAEATIMFKSLLSRGYEQTKVQLLLAHAYKVQGDMLTSEKFKAQAWITKMREMGRVTELGSNKENVPKSSSVMMKFLASQQLAAQVTENQSQDGQAGSYEVMS